MSKKKKKKRKEELERMVSGINIRKEHLMRKEQPILDNPQKKKEKEKSSGLIFLSHPNYKDSKVNDTVEKPLILNNPKKKVKKEKTRGLILFDKDSKGFIINPDDTRI